MKKPKTAERNAESWAAYEAAVTEVRRKLDELPQKIRDNEQKLLDESKRVR